ncbi:unnamed protein product [Bursaphelenchus xylophilus]|nr:unnamed protein product [Bursaphelenchus xylophilus]CAG9118745.1 unnamed protein product [Bursaphelenchus xylophilus]
MPKYQLKYLNLRGKAEPVRLCLNFVQEPFEDHRENFLEFSKRKDKHPLPRLPKLIVDGKFEICFTPCILAYLGRKYGLEPETVEEKALADVLAQRLSEYHNELKPWVYCLMDLTPAEMLDDLTDGVFSNVALKDFAPIFEKQLESNNTGYLIGDKLTWIDFYCAAFMDNCLTYGPTEKFEKFRRLNYHRNAVYALPQLQEYLRNRPDTHY